MEKLQERQYNLDLLKALAIVCMIICHPVYLMGRYIPGYEGDFAYFFADMIAGSYVVAAHGFMFAMGVGMVYSRKNSPKDLVGRGIRLLILAYALNFLRSGVYFLTYDVINGVETTRTLSSLFGCDILHFAGLAFIVTGILKKINLKAIHIFGIGLCLSVLGTALAFVHTGNRVVNTFLGLFYFTSHSTPSFNLFSWYIFVAVGILFGKILKETQNKDRLYLILLVVSGIVMIIYLIATAKFGVLFLSKENEYYAAGPIEAFGLLSIDFFILPLFHFLLKKVDASKFRLCIEMSKNINSIYCIHWCIIGATEFFFCHILGVVFSYPFMYIYAIVLIVVSFLLARFYKALKKKYMDPVLEG